MQIPVCRVRFVGQANCFLRFRKDIDYKHKKAIPLSGDRATHFRCRCHRTERNGRSACETYTEFPRFVVGDRAQFSRRGKRAHAKIIVALCVRRARVFSAIFGCANLMDGLRCLLLFLVVFVVAA